MENEPKEPTTEPTPLMEALRKQLQTILEKPLTPGTLVELEQTARLSRELMVIGKMPDLRRPGMPGMMMGGMGGLTSMYSDGATLAYAPSPQSETFGTSMVRELVAKLPELMKAKSPGPSENYASIVDAISAAREANMDDVVVKLKKKLDAMLDEPEPEPVGSKSVIVHAEPINPAAAAPFAGPPGFVETSPGTVTNVLLSSNGASS